MARMTQAQRLAHENEAQALQFFRGVLVAMPDPRRPQGVRYPLQTVVVIALMAMVCGCDDAEAMQSWGEANEPWLEGLLDMPHGAPTQDVFLAVFGARAHHLRRWVRRLPRAKDAEGLVGRSGPTGATAEPGAAWSGPRRGPEAPGS